VIKSNDMEGLHTAHKNELRKQHEINLAKMLDTLEEAIKAHFVAYDRTPLAVFELNQSPMWWTEDMLKDVRLALRECGWVATFCVSHKGHKSWVITAEED